MKKILFLTLAVLATFAASAQETDAPKADAATEKEETDGYFLTHKVTPGEQVIMISRKYMVDPADIYKYNKEAVHGVYAGMQLSIPLHKSHKKDIPAFIKSLEKQKATGASAAAPPAKV